MAKVCKYATQMNTLFLEENYPATLFKRFATPEEVVSLCVMRLRTRPAPPPMQHDALLAVLLRILPEGVASIARQVVSKRPSYLNEPA